MRFLKLLNCTPPMLDADHTCDVRFDPKQIQSWKIDELFFYWNFGTEWNNRSSKLLTIHFHHLIVSDMLIANIATDTSIQHFILKNSKNSIKYEFDTSTFSSKNAETKTLLYLSLLFHASQ